MRLRHAAFAAILAAPVLLGGCAYGPAYGPPPPGWSGESWPMHVRRCLHRFPRYDPQTDLIMRPSGNYRCPL